MRKIFAVAAAAGLMAAAAAAWAAADYSDPTKAVRTMTEAMKARDIKALRESFTASKEAEPAMDAMLAALQASTRLEKALEGKFPEETKKARGPADAAIEGQLKAVDGASVKIDGDSALVTIPAPEGADPATKPQEVKVKKIGGQWKVDAEALLDLNNPENKKAMPRAVKLTEATNAVAKEVEEGTYKTMGDAQQALRTRLLNILLDEQGMRPGTQPAGTGPATEPGTEPATQPGTGPAGK